ncbi:unnamed protein product [Adineta steineri]|uniref:Uncharacterized protein n=1 Tax=Adineta steineri TaxID=433720 RepID=A0A814DEM3_9BILA|nr:unnamed protein product [Adineta steineri]CAF4170860.1 unnamed protein product [Adineta steineri]
MKSTLSFQNENRKRINTKSSSSSLLPFWIHKDNIRYAITSLYLLRTCSISAPNLWTMIFKSSSIYFTELTFWLSNIGINWLLYKSIYLSKFPIEKRLTYSSFLSTIFNFGSLIIINNINHFFGRIESLRLISSLTLSSCLLSIGYTFLDDLNNNNTSNDK